MGTEIKQNVGGLANDEVPGLEKGRCERRSLDLPAAEQAQHCGFTSRFPCNIGVVGPGFLECQSDKFATALNPVPIIKLIPHVSTPPAAEVRCCPRPPSFRSTLSRTAGEGAGKDRIGVTSA